MIHILLYILQKIIFRRPLLSIRGSSSFRQCTTIIPPKNGSGQGKYNQFPMQKGSASKGIASQRRRMSLMFA
jgi:hypothetical protein